VDGGTRTVKEGLGDISELGEGTRLHDLHIQSSIASILRVE
jgi:hypothetical protein